MKKERKIHVEGRVRERGEGRGEVEVERREESEKKKEIRYDNTFLIDSVYLIRYPVASTRT